MASLNHLCLVLAIFLSVFALSPSSTSAIIPKFRVPDPPASSKLVAKVCSGAAIMNSRFCLKALSNPEAAAAKDAYQLTDVMMKLATSNAQATLNVINEMAAKPGSPQALKALQSCIKVYKYSIQSFGMIYKELLEDPMSANYDVSVIGPEADTCEHALAIAKVHAPRISSGNRFLQYYSGMGSEVTNLVQIGSEE